MRLNLFKSGLIDECVNENAQVFIAKIGDEQFSVKVTGEEQVEFNLWTTKIGKIEFGFLEDDKPDWVSVETENGQLRRLSADRCLFHFEHCDRGLYFLQLSRGGESYGGQIATNGYLKTRLVNSGE